MSARVEHRPTRAAGDPAAARESRETIRELAFLEAAAAAAPDTPSRQALQRSIITLHLDAGNADQASRVLESMISDGVLVWEVVDLFELITAHRGQDTARDRLMQHYECIGSFDGGARMRKIAVDFASNRQERVQRARELVRFRLSRIDECSRPFTTLLDGLVPDLAGFDDALAVVYRATLARALPSWRAAQTDTIFEDAAEGAWRAVDGLHEIYLRNGEIQRAARLLERGARLPFEHPRQRWLLHQAAHLYADRVRNPAAAIRLFKRLFEDGGSDDIARSSFDRFRELLEAGGHDVNLAWLFEQRGRRAARDGDAEGACACLERAGRLWERASDPARACEAYALGSTLGSEPSLNARARIQATRGNWQDAVSALEQLTARSADARRRHALKLAEALVALGQLERARSAIDVFLRVDPSPDEASAARALLLRIHRESRAFRSVVEMLEQDAERRPGPHAAALLCEAAELYRTELGDAREAFRCLEVARRSESTSENVHRALAETLASLQMWDALIEVLAEHVSVHGYRRATALVGLRRQLADALVGLGRADDALEHVHFAVRLKPDDASLLHARARLEVATGDLDSAERTLRAALVAAKASRESRDTRLRIEIYVDLSSIALDRSDRARAVALIESALDLAIEDEEDLSTIEEVVQKLGRHDLHARALEARCLRPSDPAERICALEALVEVWRGPLGCDAAFGFRLRGRDSLVGHVARAVAADPTARASEAAWDRLCSVSTSLEDEVSLFDIGRMCVVAIAALNQGPERAALRVAAARMFERCGSSEAALEQLFGAVEDDASHAEATATLVGMLERAGRFDEAANTLEKHCLFLGPDSPAYLDAAWHLGRLLECAHRRQEASVVYASILDALERRVTDADALRAIAVRLSVLESNRLADCLERLSTLDGASVSSVDRVVELRRAQGDDEGLVRAFELGLRGAGSRLEYVDPLVRLYEAQGDHAAASRVLRAAVLAAPHDRALLWRLAEAHRQAGSDAEALGPIDAAIQVSPSDVELRILRARVRERSDDVDGALADLRALDGSTPDAAALALPIVRRVLARAQDRAANAYAIVAADILSNLGLPEEVEATLEAVLARDPADVAALQRLAATAVLRQDWDRAADLCGRLVNALELPEHDPARAGLVVAFADACQRAGRPGDARESLELTLERQPANSAVAHELERICEAMRAWHRLSELLVARAHRMTTPARKEELLVRAATVLSEEAPGEALGLVERVCTDYPESVEASMAYARVLIKLARPNDALASLEAALERARPRSAALRAGILLEIGKAYLALEEPELAFSRLREGLSLHTRNRELAMLLGVVSHDIGDEPTAERALKIAIALSTREDGSRADDAAVDARVASRILAVIAQSRETTRTPPPRRASGIEPKPESARRCAS